MEYIQAKKKLGQNFLKNQYIIENIANSINTEKNDLIIEIGPGMGALTKELKKKNSFLVCYEIDERMMEYLNDLKDDKTKIIYRDFLQADVRDDIKNIPYQNVYVIANIPYYITSPILKKLTKLDIVKKITLLVQKEVAERIISDDNVLAVSLDFYYTKKILFNVAKNNFVPVPKVDSAVISLERKTEILDKYEEAYLKLVKESFSKRRKVLKNNLVNYNFKDIEKVLKELGYNDRVRAEDMNPQDFLTIVKFLERN